MPEDFNKKGEVQFHLPKIVDKSEIDDWMRKCTLGFLERISFDEKDIRVVKEFKDNKERYKIFNLLKEIRNSKLTNGKKR